MKNIHIVDSYKIWRAPRMRYLIDKTALEVYKDYNAARLLHRSYNSMFIEWYLHNIGYYLTKSFCKFEWIRKLNERFKDVDIEEW